MVLVKQNAYLARCLGLLRCCCAMVFVGGSEKSGLFEILLVGGAFRSLSDASLQPDQELVLFLWGFGGGIRPVELAHPLYGKESLEAHL